MPASQVSIVNAALTLLGESRILSMDDDTKAAREAKAMWDISRDALLAGYNWSFAMARAQLSALVDAPAFGFDYQYNFPADALRLIQIGDYYVGADLSDHRMSDVREYMIEGRSILTNLGAPLNVRYVARVEDPAQYIPNFCKALAAQLAYDLAEALTKSGTKKDRAENQLVKEIRLAVRANAIELPPDKLPDDEWLLSRR
jgi:hypothetical protein